MPFSIEDLFIEMGVTTRHQIPCKSRAKVKQTCIIKQYLTPAVLILNGREELVNYLDQSHNSELNNRSARSLCLKYNLRSREARKTTYEDGKVLISPKTDFYGSAN